MTSPVPSQTRAELEANLLRFLCDAQSDVAARRRVLSIVKDHTWNTPDSAVFFECIRDLFERDPKNILANLPAQLTRRGFPDMPYEILAAPAVLNFTSGAAIAETLIRLDKPEK